MNPRREIVRGTLAAAAAAALLIALSAGDALAQGARGAPQPGVLRVAAPPWPAETDRAFAAAFAEFERSYGASVQIVRLPNRQAGATRPGESDRARADALRRLSEALSGPAAAQQAAGTRGALVPVETGVLSLLDGDAPPDLLCVDASQVAPLASQGRILALEGVGARRPGNAVRLPNAAPEALRYRGRVYGVLLSAAGDLPALAWVVPATADRGLAFELLLHLEDSFPADSQASKARLDGRAPGAIAAGAKIAKAVPWEPMESGTTAHLYAVFGTSADNVYAVGHNGTIVRFDGAAWSAVKSPTSQPLLDICGRAWNDIYAVGLKGTILHFDGTCWSAMASNTSADLHGIWEDASCLFAVGALSSTQGIILRYASMGWVPQNAGAIPPLRCVFGTSNGDVWAGGGGLYRYDGSQWHTVFGAGGIYGIWGSSGGNVYTAGDSGWVSHWSGSAWEQKNISIEGHSDTLRAVWGSSPTDIFAVGDHGAAYHYDGSNWLLMNTGTSWTLQDVWGSSGSNVFAVGPSGLILHYDGAPWTPVLPEYSQTLNGICGTSASDVWVVGTAGSCDSIMYHFNGSSWSVMKCPAGAKSLACAWTATSGPVWFGGGGVYWHDAGQWGTKYGAGGIWGLWGSSADNVFGVGDGGNITRFGLKHDSWMTAPASQTLAAVWGSAANNVFAAGRDGTILHYNGNSKETWTLMQSGTKEWLEGIWGSAWNNVFAVGRNGTILRFDGSKWSAMSSGSTTDFYAVWGASGNAVFAAGAGGAILRFDGKAWATMQSPTSQALLALWGTGPSNVYAAGCDATILRFDGLQWLIVQSGSSLHPSFFLGD